MNRVLTIFVTALVVMHAAFGCCWHHAHACEVGCCEQPAVTVSACGCDAHDEQPQSPQARGDAPERDRSPTEHGDHECDANECVLALLVRSTVGSSADDLPLLLAADLPAVFLATDGFRSEVALPPLQGPRRHIVLGVLLI